MRRIAVPIAQRAAHEHHSSRPSLNMEDPLGSSPEELRLLPNESWETSSSVGMTPSHRGLKPFATFARPSASRSSGDEAVNGAAYKQERVELVVHFIVHGRGEHASERGRRGAPPPHLPRAR